MRKWTGMDEAPISKGNAEWRERTAINRRLEKGKEE
jgi:hypothetical protein